VINGLKLLKLASSRSAGWNCRSRKFWVQDVYHGTRGHWEGQEGGRDGREREMH
jgi:hypothetical protein